MAGALHIVMAAAENDALRRGKVGGVGDVLRDLPRALAALGHRVSVLVPSHGFLHRENPAEDRGTVAYPFGGREDRARVYACAPREPAPGVTILVVDHPAFDTGGIYAEDPPLRPFERDAEKFARFSAAAGAVTSTLDAPDVLHCHDWHTGYLLFLRAHHPAFAPLRRLRTAFTIHNLAYQGTRPVYGAGSTFEGWFPELSADRAFLAPWIDPRYATPCFTPLAAGIRLADRVNTVSPRYAVEILSPSDHARGFYGGEGLEALLGTVARAGRLVGILNGAPYGPARPRLRHDEAWRAAADAAGAWGGARPDALHAAMRERALAFAARPTRLVLTSVSRVAEQKVRLLFERGSDGVRALDAILALLERHDAAYAFQGSGEPALEAELAAASARSDRFVFLRGYAEGAADALYRGGDLFLMPSSFEPCGIGQMLAMREGQPCVVHAVGGLRDTVTDDVNGFTFAGEDPARSADAFVAAVGRALAVAAGDAAHWQRIRDAARAARFTWERSAREYLALLYERND